MGWSCSLIVVHLVPLPDARLETVRLHEPNDPLPTDAFSHSMQSHARAGCRSSRGRVNEVCTSTFNRRSSWARADSGRRRQA